VTVRHAATVRTGDGAVEEAFVAVFEEALSEAGSVPGLLRRCAQAMKAEASLPGRSLTHQADRFRAADEIERLADDVASAISVRRGR